MCRLVSASLFFAVCAAAFWAMPCAAQTTIVARHHAMVEGAEIRLSDVFEGIRPEDDAILAVAPVYGRSVTYDSGVLTRLAQKHRLAWRPASGAEKAVLTRSCARVTSDVLARAVLEKAMAAAPDLVAEEGRVEVVFEGRAPELVLPPHRGAAFSLADFSYDAATRRFRARAGGEEAGEGGQIFLAGVLRVNRSVPVLARSLEKGSVIGRNDLKQAIVAENRLGSDIIVREEDLLGKELRHDHGEGNYVRTADVAPPRLVMRGHVVMLKIETPLMLITAQGRAMEDGARGDVVRVKNIQSNRVVEGEVVADGVVVVGGNAQKVALLDDRGE